MKDEAKPSIMEIGLDLVGPALGLLSLGQVVLQRSFGKAALWAIAPLFLAAFVYAWTRFDLFSDNATPGLVPLALCAMVVLAILYSVVWFRSVVPAQRKLVSLGVLSPSGSSFTTVGFVLLVLSFQGLWSVLFLLAILNRGPVADATPAGLLLGFGLGLLLVWIGEVPGLPTSRASKAAVLAGLLSGLVLVSWAMFGPSRGRTLALVAGMASLPLVVLGLAAPQPENWSQLLLARVPFYLGVTAYLFSAVLFLLSYSAKNRGATSVPQESEDSY